ncbi:cobalt-precorrin-2 C(20)-methyltransferase [Andreesenia angusta]|uniref:Cobalt-precorrin-2 C(20)-methyltransferase n=1 Tax=Andreesenia angusta TaxID=39480 RepID=A0A1S1VCC5_9FIRM|nr:precorrin-2 C(20)-methyltransferase [Andreesenia angusta]OHW63449.1 cobalt-precorrin-2 C(20)-methyltransferase [Andreesenia angusta]
MRKFYGIGVGPGDPELVTVKGARLIREADCIFIPKSKGRNISKEIASDYIAGSRVVELDFPMGEDNSERYRKSAAVVDSSLSEGETGVFLTIGDPMTYSTYIYLLESLGDYKLEVETVPGISSFVTAASRLNMPLAKKGESIYVVDGEIDRKVLGKVDTVCVLKVNKRKQEILDALESEGFSFSYVRRIGQAEEQILEDREEIMRQDDYMSLLIGRRQRR